MPWPSKDPDDYGSSAPRPDRTRASRRSLGMVCGASAGVNLASMLEQPPLIAVLMTAGMGAVVLGLVLLSERWRGRPDA